MDDRDYSNRKNRYTTEATSTRMIYDKRSMFLLKMFNNVKDKPEKEIEGLLEQLPNQARHNLVSALTIYHKRHNR